MITAEQVKMARAALDWSREKLAKASGVAAATIREIEAGRTIARSKTIDALRQTLENAGLEFIRGGVRRTQETVRVFEEDAVYKLFDDILSEMRNSEERELLISGVDETKFLENFPAEDLERQIQARRELGITQKLILCEGDTNFFDSPEVYRWIPKEYFTTTPTLIYGNKVATILWETPLKIFVVQNELYASERKRNFYMIWEAGVIPPPPK